MNSSPADDVPGVSDVLVFITEPSEVSTDRIDYGGPVSIEIVPQAALAFFSNPLNPFDVNDDGLVSAADVLTVINDLNVNGTRELPVSAVSAHALKSTTSHATQASSATVFDISGSYLDVNADYLVSPADVLMVINYLNKTGTTQAASRSVTRSVATPADSDVSGELRLDPTLDSVTGTVRPPGETLFAIPARLELGTSSSLLESQFVGSPSSATTSETTGEDVLADVALSSRTANRTSASRSKLGTDTIDLSLSSFLGEMESVLSDVAEDVATVWQDESDVAKIHGQSG